MRYLMIVKATPQSETGQFPPDAEQMFADMVTGGAPPRLVSSLSS